MSLRTKKSKSMIRFILTLLLMLCTWLMSAQGKQTITITGGATHLYTSMPIEVTVDPTKDSKTVDIVTTKQEGADAISVRQVGKKIYVDLSSGNRKRNFKGSIGSIKVSIAQKGIVSYNVSTVSKVILSGRATGENVNINLDSNGYLTGSFQANTVSLNIDSASKYEGDIVAKTIKANLDSAGKAVVTGDVETLTVNIDSAAYFNGKGLVAKDVKVEADSMGKAEVYPTESLNAYADSMGSVIYYNTPKILKKYTDSMGSVKAK